MHPRLYAALLAALALYGCDASEREFDDSTMGDLGVVEFAYMDCWHDDLVCSLDHPLLPGTAMGILVSEEGDGEDVAVASSDPGVAGFEIFRDCTNGCQNFIDVMTVSAGTAKLQLRRGDGGLIDSVDVRVREPGSGVLELWDDASEDWAEAAEVSLAAGEERIAYLHLWDGEEVEMVVSGAVTWSVDARDVVELYDPYFYQGLDENDQLAGADRIEILAQAAGSAIVAARSFGVELMLAVHVTQ